MDATRSPGWYPAPDGKGEQWWNGAGWSESRKGATGVPGQLQPPAVVLPQQVAPVQRVVYSASHPAPQSPSESPEFGGAIPAAVQIDARANPAALYGLIAGIVAVVFNVLLVPSILAIIFSVRGLSKARQLATAGNVNTMRFFAVAGLVMGIFAAIAGLVSAALFIGTIISSMTFELTQ